MSQTQVERLFIKDKTSLQAQAWRITSEVAYDTSTNAVASSMSIMTGDGYGSLGGDDMTFSSGTFSFPKTGIYLIQPQAYLQYRSDGSNYAGAYIACTTDNSNYTFSAGNYAYTTASGQHTNTFAQHIFDVTDVSTHKFKYYLQAHNGATFTGATNGFYTGVTIFRLGNT